jgi:hypothetical protein
MTEYESSDGNVITAPLAFARFRALAKTYGAAVEHWPEAERMAARALLDRSQEAHDALADEALLDRILDTAEPPPPPSDDLVRELALRFEAHRTPVWSLVKRWRMPSIMRISRPGLALTGVAAAVLIVVLVQDRTALEPPPAFVLASSLPAIEFSDGAFIEDDDPLDLEIALIDQSMLDPTMENPVEEFAVSLGLTVASAPSLEDLPLD